MSNTKPEPEDPRILIALTLLAFISAPFSTVLNGYALAILWKWFIMAAFVGTPALSIPLAIGVALVVRFVIHQPVDCEPKKQSMTQRIAHAIVYPFVYSGIALLFGWIILKFM